MSSQHEQHELRHSHFNVDWEARVDFERLRKVRLSRLRERMKKDRLDGLFLIRSEHVRFATGLRPIYGGVFWLLRYGVLVPLEGEPTLFVASGDYQSARKRMPWISDMQPLPLALEDKFVSGNVVEKLLGPALKKHELTKGRIGFDILPIAMGEKLKQSFQRLQIVDAYDTMFYAKAIKDEDELALIRASTEIAAAGIITAMETVKPGIRESKAIAEAARAMFELGADHLAYNPEVVSGEHSAPYVRFSTDKVINYGDVIFMDMGAIYSGYNSDIARTYVLGKPSPEQKKIYQTLYRMLHVAKEETKPGVKQIDVVRKVRSVAQKVGYGNYLYMGIIGHGIGISQQEPPIVGEVVAKERDIEFEENMVVNYEPGIFKPGVGGFRIEDTFFVRKSGAEDVTRVPYDDALLG